MRSALLGLALLPAVAQGQAVRDSTISVTATKTTRVTPDRATLYVLVEGSAETPGDAVTRVETKLKTVSEAIKGFGSRAEPDRPITYNVGPAAQPNMYPAPVTPPSNIARAVVRVHLGNADQVARLTATALGAGASGVSTITYESSVADSIRRSKMTEVLAVARADAQTLASALDGKLGGLVEVTSSAPNVGFQGPTTINVDMRFMGGPAQVPEVVITTSVTVRYRLIR